MSTRVSEVLTGAAVWLGAAVLSAFVFVAFFAPAWPRTAWGWLLSTALGIPLLVLAQVIFTISFQLGPPRWRFVRRYSQVFRYPAASPAVRTAMLAARILLACALVALVLWLLYGVLLRIDVVRAQFR